ncbi:flagellin [Tersicoccus sp. Bi-70]|uniref:flagellin N-terminal helical domain-containing protein n=1 Tax=Tersicoccus sp. Bi-70 TaxID=1897634 RepID=UPI0009770309|nr:flagellin [Tersicoccus sp. Bi-70]OMH30604.1 flagellar hook-associated protein 3 [Tersicoccus sp. Bi-70]
MTLRITTQTMAASATRQLAAAQARLADAQDTATSLRRITRPSDDPAGAAQAMRVRAEVAANAQYGRNIDNGTAWLTGVDAALGDATRFLDSARDAVQQGLNAARTPADRIALADVIDGLRADLLGRANATYLGRSLFAGTSDQPAFVDGNPPTFTGVAGDAVHRRFGENQSVRVDADGAAIFGTGPTSVFATLDAISAELRAGGITASRLDDLDSARATLRTARADAGARLTTLEAAKDANQAAKVALESDRAALEDVDLGTAVLDLQVQQTSYQAALAVTAKTLQPTLMDFLR